MPKATKSESKIVYCIKTDLPIKDADPIPLQIFGDGGIYFDNSDDLISRAFDDAFSAKEFHQLIVDLQYLEALANDFKAKVQTLKSK